MKSLLALCLCLYAAPAYAPATSACVDLGTTIIREEADFFVVTNRFGQAVIFPDLSYMMTGRAGDKFQCADRLFESF